MSESGLNYTQTFMECLVSCALHGELTEEMARDWFEGEDLEMALKVVRAKHLHRQRPRPRAEPLTTEDALGMFHDAIQFALAKLGVVYSVNNASTLARLAAEAWLEGTDWVPTYD